jgi:hypothetical protein
MAIPKHDHQLRPISYIPDPTDPRYLAGCALCIHTETICLLCAADGDRRRHARKHSPVTDPELLEAATWAIVKTALQIAATFDTAERDRAVGAVERRPAPGVTQRTSSRA